MLSRLSCTSKTPLKIFAASLKTAARPRAITKPRVVKQTNWDYYGRRILGLSAVVGGVAVCTIGMKPDLMSDVEVSALARSVLWPGYVTDRVRSTYLYFGAGLAATAGTMVATQNIRVVQNVMAQRPFLALIGLMGATFMLSSAQRSIPYTSQNMVAKLGLAAGLYGVIGTVLGPMMHLGGPIMMRAAVYTGALVSGLTLAAITAPSERYLNYSGPLMMGFGLVAAASLAGVFLPPTGMLGGGLYVIAVYGGVVVFSGILLYQTQNVIKACEVVPYGANYDPISHSVGIYMTTINLFVRMVQIVTRGKK